MKKLVILTALILALGSVHQAAACDFGAHAANATFHRRKLLRLPAPTSPKKRGS